MPDKMYLLLESGLDSQHNGRTLEKFWLQALSEISSIEPVFGEPSPSSMNGLGPKSLTQSSKKLHQLSVDTLFWGSIRIWLSIGDPVKLAILLLDLFSFVSRKGGTVTYIDQ
jgi:hypothetical protein